MYSPGDTGIPSNPMSPKFHSPHLEPADFIPLPPPEPKRSMDMDNP